MSIGNRRKAETFLSGTNNLARLGFLAAMVVARSISAEAADGRELKLNYADPQGVELAFALLQKPETLHWLDNAIALQVSNDTELQGMPPCKALPNQHMPCRMSDLTTSVLTVLRRGNLASSLDALLASNGLARDDLASKTFLVSLDDKNTVQYIDLVGLARGQDEVLPAPDAVSAFVIRLTAAGELSVVRRRPDASVDIDNIMFSFER